MANDIEKIILKMQTGQGRAREEESKKIEEQTNILKKLEATIKAQGGNIERNADYQKASAKLDKEKFSLQKKTAGNRANVKEIEREERKAKGKDTDLLKKMAGSLGGLLKLGKITKVVKTGLFAGLSALAIGGTMLALSKFLDSKTWTALTVKIGDLAQFVANFFTSESWEKIKTRFKELAAKLKEFLFSIDYVGIINKLISFACTIRDNWKFILIALGALAIGLSLGPLGLGILAFYTIKGGWKIFKAIGRGFSAVFRVLTSLKNSLFKVVADFDPDAKAARAAKAKANLLDANDPKGKGGKAQAIIEERRAKLARRAALLDRAQRRARGDAGIKKLLAKRAALADFADLNDPKGDPSKRVKLITDGPGGGGGKAQAIIDQRIRRLNMGFDGKPLSRLTNDGGIGDLVKAQRAFGNLNDPSGDGSKAQKIIDQRIRRANMTGAGKPLSRLTNDGGIGELVKAQSARRARITDLKKFRTADATSIASLITEQDLKNKIKFNERLNRFVAADKISIKGLEVYRKNQIVSNKIAKRAGLITDVAPIGKSKTVTSGGRVGLRKVGKFGPYLDFALGAVLANYDPEMINATKNSMNPVLERSAVGGTNQLVAGTVDFVHAFGKYLKHNGLFIAPEEYKSFIFGGKFEDKEGNTNLIGPGFMEKVANLTSNSFVSETTGFTKDAKTVFTSGKADFLSGGEFESEYPTLHAIVKAGTVSVLGGQASVKRLLNSGGSTLTLNDTDKIARFMERMVEDGKGPMFSRSYSERVGEKKGLFSFFGFGKKKSQEIADLIIKTSSGSSQEVLSAKILRTINSQAALNAAAPVVINNSTSNLTTNQVSVGHPDQMYSGMR